MSQHSQHSRRKSQHSPMHADSEAPAKQNRSPIYSAGGPSSADCDSRLELHIPVLADGAAPHADALAGLRHAPMNVWHYNSVADIYQLRRELSNNTTMVNQHTLMRSTGLLAYDFCLAG
jgi:hypothetical protein